MSRLRPRQSDVGHCAAMALVTSLVLTALVAGLSGVATAEGRGPDAAAGKPGPGAGALVGHGGPVKAVALDPATRRVLTGSFDYAMMVWDVSGTEPRVVHRIESHDGAVNAVAFSANETRMLSADDTGVVRLWDTASGEALEAFGGHQAKVVDLAVSPDGHWAASASWDRTARLWNIGAMAPGAVLDQHEGPVNAVVFSGDGSRLYTAAYDGTVREWETASGDFHRVVYRHGWGINVLERVPGSDDLLFGALNGAAGVIDVASGEVVRELEPHEGPVLSLAVLDKPGLAATGGGDGVIRVWRTGDWTKLEEYVNPYGPIWAMAFDYAGRQLYYGGLDDFVTAWQVRPRAPFERVESPYPRRFQVKRTASLGERQFARKCSVCHTLKPDGRNRAGPTLYKVFGRPAGGLPDYPYSPALEDAEFVWTAETVGQLFEQGPDHFIPGSKMPLQKIIDAEERDALVAFLVEATAGDDETGGVDAGARANAQGPAAEKEETQ